MATQTLQDLSVRLSAVDGINTAVTSSASIPTINNDLNGLHTTVNQLALSLQSQLNTIYSQLTTVEAGLAGENLDQAVRLGPLSLGAGLHGPYAVNLPVSFADGNYTTEVTVTLGEAISTAACIVAGVTQQSTPGNGVNVWVNNGDSITHNVTINVFVRHD